MTGPEIKSRMEKLHREHKESFSTESAKIFILDDAVVEYFAEIEHLQKICPHEFKDGECIYCQIREEYIYNEEEV